MPAGEVVDARDSRPLAGVAVSDGRVVVRTGDDGAFSFAERSDAEFVWVTVPSSHHALVGGWFADVRGGTDAPLRFELERREGGRRAGCRFVQVTDLHVSVDDGARLRPLIEAGVRAPSGVQVTGELRESDLRADLEAIVARVHPDFVIATGDLADYGQPEELEAYRQAITGLGVPVASVPGNHDHLSCLTRQAIDEFFGGWAARDDTDGLSAAEAFQREVFGGDWRRPGSGRRPWLEVLGPLYYSFDWGGVHVVAYDGEGLRRYGVEYPQDEWLAADLAAIPAGMPVMVCTHFPEDREFYRSRFGHVRLLGSVSGHWHGTRVWRDGAAMHWTSSTLGFGGIDHTPRGYRVVEVDEAGARSRWEPMEAPMVSSSRATGRAVLVDGRVVAAREAPDASGSVGQLGGWTVALSAAARGGLAYDGDDLLVALDQTGCLHAYDARTGFPRWSIELGDPSQRWTLGAPAVVDGTVFAGSARSVHAVEGADGTERWRTDLAAADWAASWSGVTAGRGTVVVGAASDDLHLAALDATTGEVRWRHSGRDISGITVTPVLADDTVFAARASGWLVAYGLHDGLLRWEAPLDDAWPVALAVAADRALVVVRSSTGTVTAHDVDDGRCCWTASVGAGVRAGRPYSRRPGGERQPLVVLPDRVWTATFDVLVGLDLATGGIVSRTPAGAEVATVVALDGEPRAVTVDDRLVSPVAGPR